MNQVLTGAITALSATVVTLFTILRATDKRQQIELDLCKKECAEDRKRFWDLLVSMTVKTRE